MSTDNVWENIRKQNEMIQKMMEPVNTVYTAASAAEFQANITVRSVIESINAMPAFQEYYDINRKVFESIYGTANVVQESLRSVLEQYRVVEEMTSVARVVQERLLPMSKAWEEIQPVWAKSEAFVQLRELVGSVSCGISDMVELKEALEAELNASLWETYETSETEWLPDEFWEEIEEESREDFKNDFISLTNEADKSSGVKLFLKKWGEIGRKKIIQLLIWLISTFCGGFLAYISEPVYKIMAPSALLKEENDIIEGTINIPVNTEIHVWNQTTNNFIEVTCKIDGIEYDGYIKQEEFEANTEKIANEIAWEHIVYIDSVTKLLAEKWGAEPKQVYKFLKEDTDLLDKFLLEHYEVLSLLDDDELVVTIEKHCMEEKIELTALVE